MTMMGKVLKRRWSKATIQLREETKARARAIMALWHQCTNAPWHHGTNAPWHHGTAMLPLPRHCHGNNMELKMLASWHHGTIRLSHRTTAQQELEVRKPIKHLPDLDPKAGKWRFSGPKMSLRGGVCTIKAVPMVKLSDNKQFRPRYTVPPSKCHVGCWWSLRAEKQLKVNQFCHGSA